MCSFWCAYVQSFVNVLFSLQSRLPSLHSEHASLRSVGRLDACIFEAGQNERWCADVVRRTFVEATDEIPPSLFIYIYITVHVYLYTFTQFMNTCIQV